MALSYHEANVIARCPEGTIKSRVSRARLTLAHLLSIDRDGSLTPMG
jgi:DNA-directed RNA polymerase specialized sigma24 family protein